LFKQIYFDLGLGLAGLRLWSVGLGFSVMVNVSFSIGNYV